jgi:MOSC domain-containing protein YiiM
MAVSARCDHPDMMRVVSVQVGLPRVIPATGDGGPWDRVWETAFVKEPVDGPVMLRTGGLDGDGQSDRRSHGGPDMAVLVYSADHYPLWRAELDMPGLGPGGFGENLTVAGLDERTACIGDVYELGETLLQLSQPRGPCFKISWRWRRADLLERVRATGHHGWYVRALREGPLEAGQEMRLVERPHPRWTVRLASDVYARRREDPGPAAELAACTALAARVRTSLEAAAGVG